MKKIYTHFNILTFTLLNLCSPVLCSENSWSLKTSTTNKNWLQNKIDAFAKQMVNRTTYTHKSFEHARDLGILHVLPTPVSQAILAKQRENMKNFLLRNEENALEGIREYWGFDQEDWSKIMNQAKEEHEFNLSEMRKDQNFNTYHDPALPRIWTDALKSECKRHDANPNSLNFRVMTEEEEKQQPEACATTQGDLSSNRILWQNYNLGTIALNLNNEVIKNIKTDMPTKNMKALIDHMACHEIIHAIKGDYQKQTLIVIECTTKKFLNNFSLSSLINPSNESIKIAKEYSKSAAHRNFLSAIEKTADTLVPCTDSDAAKNAAISTKYGGYPDNVNDMHVINTNWETSQKIKTSQNTLQSLKNKIRQTTNLF